MNTTTTNMIQTQPSEWKAKDEAIEMLKDVLDKEADWKVVGSRSRRESRVFDGATSNNNNHATVSVSQASLLINQHQQPDFERRGSACSEKQWGFFGGFQWEGHSIFEQEIVPAPKPPLSLSIEHYDPTAISSTPTLPTVPLKPIHRQQRSFSFSLGQDPAFFGYDDRNAGNANSFLTPTLEEEEEKDQLSPFDDDYLRSRSQSSNAAFGNYPEGMNILNRRASLGCIDSPSSTLPGSLIGNSKYLLSQRRMSQPLNYTTEDSFPEILTTHGNQPPFSTISIHQVSDYLENTHIHRSSSSSLLQNRPFHIIPETSSSATVIPFQQQETPTGKGLLLQRLPLHIPLFMIEFKSGRTDFYYVSDPSLKLRVGDLVLVEADRGKDLGKVATDVLTVNQVLLLQQQQKNNNNGNILIIDQEETDDKKATIAGFHVKRVYKIAAPDEVSLLLSKEQDEHKALAVCLQKIKNRKLSMEVVDAEFQWDRRKLTFYFIAERRIDFRELVRELFKIYKTRIWMCAVNPDISSKASFL